MDLSARLLIDEQPLQVLPSLAAAIGLNEAIFLQQLHYHLRLRQHVIDGVPWFYNTLEQWHTKFPFWSVMTIRRVLSALEHRDLVRSANHNKNRQDQTKWYTINYERLRTISVPMNISVVQNEHMDCSERTPEVTKMNISFPKRSSKKTSKKETPAVAKERTPEMDDLSSQEVRQLLTSVWPDMRKEAP